MNKILIKKIVHWLLLILVINYLISGLGITHYRIVEKLTLGVLSKSLSFKIHNDLLWPFLALLIAHVYLTVGFRFKRQGDALKNKKSRVIQ